MRVKGTQKKMRWAAGSRFLDLLLTFIGENRELTGRAGNGRRRGMTSGSACIDAPQICAPSEQWVGHAPESLIENRTCSNSLMGISIFEVNAVRPAFRGHIPGEGGFSILDSRSEWLGENDSLLAGSRSSLCRLRLREVGLIGSVQCCFDSLPIFGGNGVAKFSLEHLAVHNTRRIMLQRSSHVARTFYQEIMAMVRKDDTGCDDHDSRDRIAPSVHMIPHGHQSTNTIIFLVEICPTLLTFRKSVDAGSFFTEVRKLNCNLSRCTKRGEVHVSASIAS